MNRRGFLKALSGIIGGIAVAEAVPLGRVWSFPSQIKIANSFEIARDYYSISWPVITRDWQFNFYDLRPPVIKLYPSTTKFRGVSA